MKFSDPPTNAEMLAFARKAKELHASWRAKGVNPTLSLPDGTSVSLLDQEGEELIDSIAAVAAAGIARGEP